MNEPEYDPAEGSVGYLTWDQFERFRRADHNARKYVPWLRVAGYLRSGTDPDEHRGRSVMAHPPIGLPATWLAAEEITRLSYELNQWATLEDAARDDYGSEVALLYTREVETAVAKWPIADRSRSVRFFSCTACNQDTLRYFPPTYAGDELLDVAVKCTNRECRNVMDAAMFERMAVVILAEWELRNGKRRLDPGVRGTEKGGPELGDDLPVAGDGQDPDYATNAGSVALPA